MARNQSGTAVAETEGSTGTSTRRRRSSARSRGSRTRSTTATASVNLGNTGNPVIDTYVDCIKRIGKLKEHNEQQQVAQGVMDFFNRNWSGLQTGTSGTPPFSEQTYAAGAR
jgi:hypothetical protein